MTVRKRGALLDPKHGPARRAPTPRGVGRELVAPSVKVSERRLASEKPEFDRLTYLRSLVRDIPNFPKPGILFRDITPLLADPKAFHIVLDTLAEQFVGDHVDAVVGIESRGFIFGGALAARLNASFVPVRKPGKLPHRVDRVSYSLEYGESELEMHRDSLPEGTSVIIMDDLLATGGTAFAAAELVHRQGAYVAGFAFVIELESLAGRDRLLPTPVYSLLSYL
jgi:adenine phosphoribosyltransferase